MTRYKQAEFEDEDCSSLGSVALNSAGISASATHIRYHPVSFLINFILYYSNDLLKKKKKKKN